MLSLRQSFKLYLKRDPGLQSVAAADRMWILGCSVGVLVLVVVWATRMLKRYWWEPRRLERALRAQGLDGTAYRFPRGDLADNARLLEEAKAKPMPLSHDIFPRISPLLHHTMEKYGSASFTWFGPVPRVTITDPDLVKEVLSNKSGHFGRTRMNPLSRFLLGGLASYEGDKWAKHRRILNPAFHIEKLKRMLPAFSACCVVLVERWEGIVRSEACHELDVWREFQSLTGDVISRTAFGTNFEEGRRIFQLQSEQVQLVINTMQYVYIPGFMFLPTRANNRIKAIDREIRAVLTGIIKKREGAIKRAKGSDDLLGLLLESNAQQLQEHGTRNAGMSTEEVIQECKLFYFAGQETTSVLLTWTMVALSMHPSWQELAREEVLQVFGKEDKPDFNGLSRLKTVTAILYEVLRLYTPGILLQRQTNETVKLGEVVYPPGVVLLLPVISIHHDTELWGADAKEFNPERFAEGISKASADKHSFFPFGGGPQICIGQNFALLEAKIGLSMILQRFTFELSPLYVHAPLTMLTLQPQHGAQLRLRRISEKV